MAYTRRVVWWDGSGRRRVTFRSMGDGPITDPSQVDNDGEIQMPDDYVGHDFNSNDSEEIATVGPSCVGPSCTSSTNPPPVGTPIINTNEGAVAASAIKAPPSTLVLAAALAGGAYLLFGRKRKKR